MTRRTPHGVRGLKFMRDGKPMIVSSRTPHGVRGLKWRDQVGGDGTHAVAPLTGCVD